MHTRFLTSLIALAALVCAGCGDQIQPLDDSSQPAQQGTPVVNYLGAPGGESLPYLEVSGFGGSFRETDAIVARERLADIQAFGSARFAWEMNTLHTIGDAGSLAEAMPELKMQLDEADADPEAVLPRFVREQAVGFALLQHLQMSDATAVSKRDANAVLWALGLLKSNGNGSLPQVAHALDLVSSHVPDASYISEMSHAFETNYATSERLALSLGKSAPEDRFGNGSLAEAHFQSIARSREQLRNLRSASSD